MTLLRFVALLFVALALGPALAHLLELPNAFLCIVGTQAIFWTFTYPANQQTANWTLLPESWQALRAQWEYSHAASAVLNLGALIAVAFAVLKKDA